MIEYFEFAELSFDKTEGDECTIVLFATAKNPVIETSHADSWMDELAVLGRQGWAIGGVIQYETRTAILMQRKRIIK